MSDNTENTQTAEEQFNEADSKADAVAMFSLVIIAVLAMVFFVNN